MFARLCRCAGVLLVLLVEACTSLDESLTLGLTVLSASTASATRNSPYNFASNNMSDFIAGNPEDADHNQYWYSNFTIQEMVKDLTIVGGKIAFLSTPSIYFTMPEEHRKECWVFDVSSSSSSRPRWPRLRSSMRGGLFSLLFVLC